MDNLTLEILLGFSELSVDLVEVKKSRIYLSIKMSEEPKNLVTLQIYK